MAVEGGPFTQEMTTAPLNKSVTVACSVEQAFRLFTEGMSSWWPLATHSIYERDARTCVFEPKVGGRIYEISADGREGEWGVVLEWDPPHRAVFSWNPNPDREASTEIEVRFSPEGSGARLDLEHRAWENLGDGAARLRPGYETGWDVVLRLYVDAGSTDR